MGLNDRLERLEAAWAEAGCVACSGPGATIVMDSDGPPQPCPACGAMPEPIPFTIRITDDEEEGAGWAS